MLLFSTMLFYTEINKILTIQLEWALLKNVEKYTCKTYSYESSHLYLYSTFYILFVTY